MISWDMTYKDSEGSDYVVGQLWLRDQADMYLVAQIRGRLDITETVKAVQALHDYAKGRWSNKSFSTLVEDRANGPAVISMLRKQMLGLIPIKPEGGKESRAHAVAPQIEGGNVHLPCSMIPAPAGYKETATEAFVEECAAFPRGAHDDQVDAMSQVLPRLAKSGSAGRVRSGGTRRKFPL
jgi:predicted phage terminase large subunit-like protein